MCSTDECHAGTLSVIKRFQGDWVVTMNGLRRLSTVAFTVGRIKFCSLIVSQISLQTNSSNLEKSSVHFENDEVYNATTAAAATAATTTGKGSTVVKIWIALAPIYFCK